MDLIGAAASVLQLVGVAITSVKVIHDAVAGYRDAPKQMLVLERDVDQLVNTLTQINMVHDNVVKALQGHAPGDDATIRGIFSSLRSPVNDCHRDLDDLQRYTMKMRIGPGNQGKDKVWKRLKIMIKEKEFQGLKDRISHNLQALSLQETLVTQQLSVSNIGWAIQIHHIVTIGHERISRQLNGLSRDFRQTTEAVQVLQSSNNTAFSDSSRQLRDMRHQITRVGDTVTQRMDEMIAINGYITKTNVMHHQEVSDRMSYIQDSLSSSKKHENEQLQLKIMKWLSKLDFRQTYKELHRRVHPGTGRWFLELEEYQTFLESQSSTLLWCTAKPGFGKSSLASVVADNLEETVTKDPTAVFLCLFIDKRDPRTLDSSSLVANLVKQLCWELHTQSRDFPDSLVKFFKEGKSRGSKLSFLEGRRLIGEAAALFSHVYIVVDGLDECHEYTAGHDRDRDDMGDVLQLLRDYVEFESPVIKVLITSRMNEDIRIGLGKHTFLKMTAKMNQDDINIFLRAIIGERSERTRRRALRFEIIDKLASRADGMFQYVKFQIKNIEGAIDDRSILDAVDKFPEGLDEVYEGILCKVNAQLPARRDLAWKVFIWTVHAVRPLTLAELSEALCIRPEMTEISEDVRIDPSLIIDVCKGLIISDEDLQVKADHTSIHEFLTRRVVERSNIISSYSVAESCLTYLLFDDFRLGPCSTERALDERLLKHPFIAYVALFWQEHVRGKAETTSRKLLMDFVSCFPAVECCWQVYHFIKQNSRKFPNAASVLHIFARCGFETIRYLKIDREMLTKQGKGGAGTPLHAAAWGGHLNAIDFLLARAKDEDGNTVIDVNATSDFSWTPLHLAIFNGHLAVMKRLLAAGASLNLRHAETGNYPLHLASFGPNPDIVQALLEHGAKVDVKNLEEIMPLYFAVTFNRARTVELLLESGADEFARATQDPKIAEKYEEPNDGPTLFYQAATTGSKEPIELLLNVVPKRDHCDMLSCALSAAVHADDSQLMKFLINSGANVNFIFRKWASLHIAAKRGYTKSLELLLENDASIEIRTMSKARATPLAIAAVSGKEDCIEVLLKHKARITGLSQMGSSLLDCVCENDDEDVVLRIISRYNLAERMQGESHASVAIAASKGHCNVVELLLEVGYHPDILSPAQGLNLESATVDKPGIADSKGANETMNVKRGAMHTAAANGHLEVINLLYDANAKLDLLASNGYSPLHEAAFHGQATVVEWLLNKGANPCLRDADNCTALELASFEGHSEVVELLNQVSMTHEGCPCHTLNHDLPLPGEDFIDELEPGLPRHQASPWPRRRSSLRLGSRSRRSSIQESLYEAPGTVTPLSPTRSVVSLRDYGLGSPPLGNSAIMGTPLHLAAYYGQDEVVQMLLKEGVDPRAGIAEGVTQNALHLAVSRNKYESAEMLLTNGMDPNTVDAEGYTPLGYAAKSGNDRMTRLLIKHHAHVDAVASRSNNANMRALEIAILKGHERVFGALVAAGAQLDKPCLGHTPLMLAASLGHDDIVCQLIENGVDVNATGVGDYQGLRAIHMAILERQEPVLWILLDSGASLDPKSHGPTPLMVAACMDDDHLVTILAERGASLNAAREACTLAQPVSNLYDCNALRYHGQMTAAHFAVSKGASASLRTLIQFGADVNARSQRTSNTPLHFAVHFEDLEGLRALVEAGADIDARDDLGWSPFDHTTVMKGYQTSACELVRLAPSLATRVVNGLPAFALAAYLKQEILLRQILDAMEDTPWKLFSLAVLKDDQASVAGMLVFFTDDLPSDEFLDWTPIFLAVLLERTELLMLIDTLWWKKPFPLARADRYGMTPLHWAAAAGLDNMIKTIISMEYPDPRAKDNWSRTPDQLALYQSTRYALQISVDGLSKKESHGKSQLRSWVPKDLLDEEQSGRTNLFTICCDCCRPRKLIDGGYHWCKVCKLNICSACVIANNLRYKGCYQGNGHKLQDLETHLFMLSPCKPKSRRVL